MSTPKFTPGPWTVDGTKALGAYGVWTENADPRNLGHDGAGYQVQICSMNPMGIASPIERDERGANARLIAAAPDLYAVCLAISDELDEADAIILHRDSDGAVAIRAALAKVVGIDERANTQAEKGGA